MDNKRQYTKLRKVVRISPLFETHDAFGHGSFYIIALDIEADLC